MHSSSSASLPNGVSRTICSAVSAKCIHVILYCIQSSVRVILLSDSVSPPLPQPSWCTFMCNRSRSQPDHQADHFTTTPAPSTICPSTTSDMIVDLHVFWGSLQPKCSSELYIYIVGGLVYHVAALSSSWRLMSGGGVVGATCQSGVRCWLNRPWRQIRQKYNSDAADDNDKTDLRRE